STRSARRKRRPQLALAGVTAGRGARAQDGDGTEAGYPVAGGMATADPFGTHGDPGYSPARPPARTPEPALGVAAHLDDEAPAPAPSGAGPHPGPPLAAHPPGPPGHVPPPAAIRQVPVPAAARACPPAPGGAAAPVALLAGGAAAGGADAAGGAGATGKGQV